MITNYTLSHGIKPGEYVERFLLMALGAPPEIIINNIKAGDIETAERLTAMVNACEDTMILQADRELDEDVDPNADLRERRAEEAAREKNDEWDLHKSQVGPGGELKPGVTE